MAEDALKTYWDHFFKAETGTYEYGYLVFAGCKVGGGGTTNRPQRAPRPNKDLFGGLTKSTWLDLFLAEFLIRLNDGANPKELINFCPVSGVVTLVGCELLCGIHRVTSAVSAHCATPAPADSEPPTAPVAPETKPEERVTGLFTLSNAQPAGDVLRRYLLAGVAWRCLRLLRALGVEVSSASTEN
ncbi:hypothetical protein MSG28_006067 [Choristoneura fumiferana]|uniref:Uncharacterized protein n=1 Tax=Choristoneura fumiferana TaxID=7141 RepID=A0ACC0JDG4_CHOFU|nr:hypothetical protein MSG28_006067 [Choristoneura fumiferana]